MGRGTEEMQELDFEPELVGRDQELNELKTYLDMAAKGKGGALFIAGEAGIGKTRLVNEFKQAAESKGFRILSGNSMFESLTPYMPFLEALRSGGLDSLFSEDTPRVECVYLMTSTGLLVMEVLREDTGLDPDLFAAMLTTVGDFVKDSLSMLEGREGKDTLNRLGYGEYTILIESRRNASLATILKGKENEFLINDMREILATVDDRYGSVLSQWDGEEESVRGTDDILKTLIISGKYDGVYYGKEDPKTRRNLLFENVSMGLVRQTEMAPTLLCIEDLQWADPSSLALMHYVTRNTKNSTMLILGTYRPEDVTVKDGKSHHLVEAMQRMGREELLKKIELKRLSKHDVEQMLFSHFGRTGSTEEFQNRIYRETEGNPLFIIELIKLMIDEEIIKIDDGTWRLTTNLEDMNIPSKIYDVIARRLNRLEDNHREILDCASIIGEEFDSDLLSSTLDLQRIEMLKTLRTLEQKHKLIHSEDGNYKFDHAKIKEVLYSEIPTELRREYHALIAESIEKLNRNNLDKVADSLAFHYYNSRNRYKAGRYLTKAAEKAKREYSNEEAIMFYNEALELEEVTKKRMEIFESLGDVCDLIGDYKKCIEMYSIALELAEDKSRKAEIMAKIGQTDWKKGEFDESLKICIEVLDLVKGEECKAESLALDNIGSVHHRRGEYDSAIEHFKKSLTISEKIGDQSGVAQCFNNIGIVHKERGEYDEALKYYEKSLELMERIGDQRGISASLHSIGNVHADRGEYDRSLEYYWKSLRIKERIGDQMGIAKSYNNLGIVYSDRGGPTGALVHYEKSLEIYEKIGDLRGVALSLNNIGIIYLEKGKPEEALERYQKSLEIRKKIGDQSGVAGSFNNIGIVYKERGEYDRALECYEKSLNINEKIGDHRTIAANLGNIGVLHCDKGEYNKALEYLEKSLEIRDRIGDQRALTQSYCWLAETYFKKMDLRKATEFCEKALNLSKEIGVKENEAKSKRIFGMIYREHKNWKESIKNFEESVRIFKEIGIQMELGKSYHEFGLMWKAKGEFQNAEEWLKKALEIFEKLKLEKNVEKVREILP